MKKTIIIMMLLLGLTSCGKDNSSGGDNSGASVNGVAATTRFMQMASSVERPEVMYDEVGVFALELLKDRSFALLRQTRRGFLRELIAGTWDVNGTNIILPRVGTGSFMESNENGRLYECLYFLPETFGAIVRDQLIIAGVAENRMMKFCKRL